LKSSSFLNIPLGFMSKLPICIFIIFYCCVSLPVYSQTISYRTTAPIITQASFDLIQHNTGTLNIAYLPPATEFNFYLDIWEGITSVASEAGFEVFLMAPQRDNPAEQMRMLKNVIQQEISALILSTHDEESAAPLIKQAIENGIVVIVVNSDTRNYSTPVHGIVGYEQRNGTYELGQYALSLAAGKAMQVGILEGEPGYHSSERVGGFEDAIKDSNLKIVARNNGHWNTEGGYYSALNMFKKHPEIGMVFAANDFEIIGVSSAMQSLGLKDVILLGNDGVSSVLPRIADGRIVATVNTDPTHMGKVAMQVALDSVRGKFHGGFVETPTELITQANVTSFLDDQAKETISVIPEEIRVVSEELPGLTNNDGTGLYCDILREIYEPLGIDVGIKIVPLKRAQFMIENNDADVMLGHSHWEGENIISPQWHYSSQIISAIFKKERTFWIGQQSLVGKRVGWIRGADYDKYLTLPISGEEKNDHLSPLFMLEADRLDFFLEDRVQLMNTFQHENDQLTDKGFESSNYQVEKLLELKLYPGFSDTPIGHKLSMIFDDQIPQLLKSGKLRDLYERWNISTFPFIQESF